MNTSNDVKTIYLNTPKGLNLELLFNDCKPVLIPKVQFLIHQINFNHKNGGYQINKKNHSWFLGIKDGELTSILSKLLDNNIIVRTEVYLPGVRSNKYSMVEPFDITDTAIVNKHVYQVSKHLFLQKWVADGNIVKAKKFSAFKKEIKKETKEQILMNELQQAQTEIEALKARVNELENKDVKDNIPSTSIQPEPLIKAHTITEPDDETIDLEDLSDWDDEVIISSPVEIVIKTLKDYDYNSKDNESFITFQSETKKAFLFKDRDMLNFLDEFSDSELIEMMDDFFNKPTGEINIKYNHKISLCFKKQMEDNDIIISFSRTIKTLSLVA